MSEVWKFKIPAASNIEIAMPDGAVLLHFGLDPSFDPCVWAAVSPWRPRRNRLLRLVGTGQKFDDDLLESYVGSVVQGTFVWHLFDVGWCEEYPYGP